MYIGNKHVQAIVILIAIAAVVGFMRYRHAPAVDALCEKSCLAASGCDLNFDAGHSHKIGDECLIRQNSCIAMCRGGDNNPTGVVAFHDKTSQAVAAGGAYGAIALDEQNGAWGLSDASPDEDSANRTALAYCSGFGPHCSLAASFSNSCAAIAKGDDNIMVWAKGPNQEAAQKSAIQKCAKKTSASCVVQRWNCYLVPKHSPPRTESPSVPVP